MGNYDDGTGFGRDECGCAYTHPVETAYGEARLCLDQGEHERNQQGWLRTLAPQIPLRADGLRFLLVHGQPAEDE